VTSPAPCGQIGQILPRARIDGIQRRGPGSPARDRTALFVERHLYDIGFVVFGGQCGVTRLHIEGDKAALSRPRRSIR